MIKGYTYIFENYIFYLKIVVIYLKSVTTCSLETVIVNIEAELSAPN